MKYTQVIPNSRSKTAKIVAIVAAVFLPSVVAYAGYVAYTRFERKKYIKKIKKVLFLGDSQSVPNQSYADLVASNMGWEYEKHAKIGAKTDWIWEKYRDDLRNYDAIIVMIGGNDIWATGSSEQAISNLKLIKSLAVQRNHSVILISPPSKDFYSSDENKLREYRKIGDWMRSNADLYVDGTTVTDSTKLFQSDNLHLNEAGQRRIAYYLTEALKSL